MDKICFEIRCNGTDKLYCKLFFEGRVITSKILKHLADFCGDEFYVSKCTFLSI